MSDNYRLVTQFVCCLNRGRQSFSCRHIYVQSSRVYMRRTLRNRSRASAAHRTILHSRVNAVIIAATHLVTILWVLWRHTEGLNYFLAMSSLLLRDYHAYILVTFFACVCTLSVCLGYAHTLDTNHSSYSSWIQIKMVLALLNNIITRTKMCPFCIPLFVHHVIKSNQQRSLVFKQVMCMKS